MVVTVNIEIKIKFVRFLQRWGATNLLLCEKDDNTQDEVVAIGGIQPGDVEENGTYRFFGKWEEHHTHGMRFRVYTHVESQPLTKDGIVQYLRRAPGMTLARARRVFRSFDSESISQLKNDPEGVRKAVNLHSWTEEMAAEASAHLKTLEHIETSIVELIQLFEGMNLPLSLPTQCVARFHLEAVKTVRDNPYELLEFRGVGFPKADALYMHLGLNPNALERQALCIWHYLRERRGDTWMPKDYSIELLRQKVSGTEIRVKDAVRWGRTNGYLSVRQHQKAPWLAEKNRADAEHDIAYLVADTLDCEPSWPISRKNWPSLFIDKLDVSAHQGEQLQKALTRRIGIFGGAPGTGKTYAAVRLIGLIQRREPQAEIALCAPTGKAANRFTEVLREFGIKNLFATTVHRLLVCQFQDDTHYNFEHNEDNPLPHKYIIVDEASMLDADLCASLLHATSNWAHVLLVGDVDQLPPVGHGAPLRDLIASGHVPVGHLTEIQRNAGDIVKFCTAIKNEEKFKIQTKMDLPKGHNLMLRRHETANGTISCMLSMLRSIIRTGKTDPVWEVQIVCPMNTRGDLSREKLNKVLQKTLNAHNESKNLFWTGDKVVCQKNSWFPAVDAMTAPDDDVLSQVDKHGNLQIYVANGELGKVVEEEPRRTLVQFQRPKRYVVVPRGGEGQKSLVLGYCLTVHKSQGSEWPVVIVICDPEGRAVTDRPWLYTAASRAKAGCILIGTEKTIHAMRMKKSIGWRNTFLVTQLQEQIDAIKRSHEGKNPLAEGEGFTRAPAEPPPDHSGHPRTDPVDIPLDQSR